MLQQIHIALLPHGAKGMTWLLQRRDVGISVQNLFSVDGAEEHSDLYHYSPSFLDYTSWIDGICF